MLAAGGHGRYEQSGVSAEEFFRRLAAECCRLYQHCREMVLQVHGKTHAFSVSIPQREQFGILAVDFGGWSRLVRM